MVRQLLAIPDDARGRLRTLVTLAVLVLAALGTQVMRVEMRRQEADLARLNVAEAFYLPPPGVLRVASLGHEQLVADLLFIRAASYFMDHLYTDRRYPWLTTYIDTIIALDRDNPEIYRWASQVVKYGQFITNADVLKSIRYSEMGAERFPNDWRFWMDIGFNYLVEWHTDDPEERDRMQSKALDYFAVSSMLPGTQLDPSYVTALYVKRNDTKMALFAAYQRYFQASDREREELLGWIRELETKEGLAELETADAQWKEQFPFVSRAFYSLLGPRSAPKVPATWDELDDVYRVMEGRAAGDEPGAPLDEAPRPSGGGGSSSGMQGEEEP